MCDVLLQSMIPELTLYEASDSIACYNILYAIKIQTDFSFISFADSHALWDFH